MAQVVHVFEDQEVVLVGTVYGVQVCGRPNGHVWEGWLEFIADDGSDVRRTARETTQPDLEALTYWSEGLSPTYLEGAMARTMAHPDPPAVVVSQPYFDEPAAPPPVDIPDRVAVQHAVLDPFSVASKGADVLRSELGALRAWHLRNIIRAYELADPSLDLEALSAGELIDVIVNAVETV
jgi:hypothetical protein